MLIGSSSEPASSESGRYHLLADNGTIKRDDSRSGAFCGRGEGGFGTTRYCRGSRGRLDTASSIPFGHFFHDRLRNLRRSADKEERRMHRRKAISLPGCHGRHGTGLSVCERCPGLLWIRPLCLDVRNTVRRTPLLSEDAGV
ncbi:hypothetical protein CEXT_417421 [Caerostris extrusa]|uniref:Uncharacterized protein n=1 Tax=Caerostris extrusa TaxID=172846 RepID=A0AAV4R0R0_CAEEX|nr:hypothetical protein CEXT_417421 [Caerostris extrusa]